MFGEKYLLALLTLSMVLSPAVATVGYDADPVGDSLAQPPVERPADSASTGGAVGALAVGTRPASPVTEGVSAGAVRTANQQDPASSASAASSGTVEGCFFYYLNDHDGDDDTTDGGTRPGRQLVVQVWDQNFGANTKITSGRTGDDGCFEIPVPNPSGQDAGKNNVADVYVKVLAKNPAAAVTNHATRVLYKVQHPSGSRELDDGETVDFGTFTPTNDNMPYRAADWVLEARKDVANGTSPAYTRDRLRIQHPQSGWPSYFSVTAPGDPFEHIALPTEEKCNCSITRTTLYHEYGHGLFNSMYEKNALNWPVPYKPLKRDHVLWSERSPGFAMIEGWPKFLEAYVQGSGGTYHGTYDLIENETWFNGAPPGGEIPDDSNAPGGDTGDMDGNKVEGSYAGIWLDIVDGRSNDDDGLNRSFDEVFDVVDTYHPTSMREFHRKYVNDNPGVNEEALTEIFFEHGILLADPFEPNGRQSAAAQVGQQPAVRLDTSFNATIDAGTDYYAVTVRRNTNLSVNVTREAGIGDPSLELRESGTVVGSTAASDDDPLNTTSPNSGRTTYFLKVTSAEHALYRVDVSTYPGNDTFEDNDDIDEARYLDSDGTREARVVDGERDTFEVFLADGETLNASVENAGGEFDVEVYDTWDDVEASTEGTGATSLEYTADARRNHTFGVVGADNQTFWYDLNVTTTGPQNDFYEPNDQLSTANAQFVRPVRATIVNGESDWYAVYPEDGALLATTLREADHFTTVTLYDRAGQELGQDGYYLNDIGDGRVRYLEVTTDSNVTTDYTLDVEVEENYWLNVDPDGFEDNDDLSNPTEVSRAFENASLTVVDGDVDVYAVDLRKGDPFDVSLGYNQSLGNLAMTLYGPGQVPLTDAGFGDERSLTVEETGTYYVEVYQTEGGDMPYNLSITSNDEFEDNDARADAAPAPVETFFSGSLDEGSTSYYRDFRATMLEGEDDWYEVHLEKGKRLSVGVTPVGEAANTRFTPLLVASVYRPDGRYITETTTNGGLVAEATSTGTHYVRVHPWLDTRYTTDYNLSVHAGPGLNASANDDFLSATPYDFGLGDADAQVTLDDDNTADYYTTFVEAGEAIEVGVGFTGSSDVDVDIYDSERDRVVGTSTDATNTNNLSADTIASESGRYFVVVSGAEDPTTYDLEILHVDDDTTEPDDAPESAAPLATGEWTYARLFEETDAEADYYAVNLTAFATTTATLEFDQVNLFNGSHPDVTDLDLAWVAANGTVLAENTTVTDDATVVYTPDESGVHYLRVDGLGPDTVTPYRLRVDSQFVTFDPIFTLGTFTFDPLFDLPILDQGVYYNLSLPPAENESYPIQLAAGERLDVTANTTGDLDLQVTDGSGTTLASGENATAFEADENGTYYVRTASGDASVEYTLNVSTTLRRPDPHGATDDFESATRVHSGDALGDRRTTAEDTDFYAVDLAVGDDLTAEVLPGREDVSLGVTVYDPDRNGVASGTAGPDDATVTHTAQSSGTYYVEVDGDRQATYGLRVTARDPDNDRFESNEDRATAASLLPGTYNLTLARSDRDVVSLPLDAGETLSVDLTSEGGNPNLVVYSPDGSIVTNAASRTPGESLAVRVNRSGDYFVEVNGDAATSVDYTLALSTRPAPADDRFGANDDIDSAASVSPGTLSDLRLLQDESDVFAVDLAAGENLTVSARFAHADGDLDLLVADPDGTLLASSASATDDETVRVTADAAGEYYVRVVSPTDASTTYALELAVGESSSGDASGPTRTAPDTVAPGGTATVVLEATATNASVSFLETFDPAVASASLQRVTVDGVEVSPFLAQADRNGALVTFREASAVSEGATVTVEYALTVPDDAAVGSVYTIEGNVTTGSVRPVGTDRITVEESAFDGAAAQYNADGNAVIDIQELGAAAADYAEGKLTIVELGQVAAAYAES